MTGRTETLRMVAPHSPPRMVPAPRFAEMAEQRNAERKLRLAAEAELMAANARTAKVLAVVSQLLKNLATETSERLVGVGIMNCANLSDTDSGALHVRINVIASGSSD
jgi:hypothetical protein